MFHSLYRGESNESNKNKFTTHSTQQQCLKSKKYIMQGLNNKQDMEKEGFEPSISYRISVFQVRFITKTLNYSQIINNKVLLVKEELVFMLNAVNFSSLIPLKCAKFVPILQMIFYYKNFEKSGP